VNDALQTIRESLEDSARTKRELTAEAPAIAAAAAAIARGFREGGRLYACGNGGSACDAMHLVEELVARYRRERPGLPAHHLLDAATLTCWANDYEYRTVFRRQVETMARAGDTLVAISTSGNSPNVLEALHAAGERGVVRVGLTGAEGGEMQAHCEHLVRVPSGATERIQEAHITVIHLFCELVERELFGS
jgi:D-sedoheptulose 7-phosphate isomerase